MSELNKTASTPDVQLSIFIHKTKVSGSQLLNLNDDIFSTLLPKTQIFQSFISAVNFSLSSQKHCVHEFEVRVPILNPHIQSVPR